MDENVPPPGDKKKAERTPFKDAFKVKVGQNLNPLKRTTSQVEPEHRRVKVRVAPDFNQKHAKPLISEPVQKLDMASFKDTLYSMLEQKAVPLSRIINVIIEGVLIVHWCVYFSYSTGEDIHLLIKPMHVLSLGLEIVFRHAIANIGYQQKLNWGPAEKFVPLLISLVTNFNTKSISHPEMSIFFTLNSLFEDIGMDNSFEQKLFALIVSSCNSDPAPEKPAPCIISQDAPDSGYWRTEERLERHVVALEDYYVKGDSSELVETSSFEEKRYRDYMECHLKLDLKATEEEFSFGIHPEEMRFMLVNPTWKNLPYPIPSLAEDAAGTIWKPTSCLLDAFHGNLIIDPYSSDICKLMHMEIKRLTTYKPCNKKPEVASPRALSRGQIESTTLYLSDSELEVVKKIGQGSFGRVFKVVHAGKTKILKIQKSNMAIREFYILTQVQQRQARYRDQSPLYQSADTIFFHAKHSAILGNFYSGITLLEFINTSVKSPDGLGESKVAFITKQLIDAMLSLHNMGILHNDIKLDNILIDQATKARPLIRLIDFGRSIDLRLLPPNAELVAIKAYVNELPADVQRLSPYQQDLGRPWLYHEDYFGSATVIYSMLTCRILETFRMVSSTDPALPPRFSPTPSIPRARLTKASFWVRLLDVLINPDLIVLERMLFRPKPAFTSPSYRNEIQAQFIPLLTALIEKL